MDFTGQTERFILESGMLRQKESVTVGISGGADSVCLFLQLYALREKLGIGLKAVTVEHGIRGEESERDAAFAKELCESRGICCRIVHVDAPSLSAKEQISLEEAARRLRYEAFFQDTEEGEAIALAHHLEDQAETVLFHLIRGSGVRGLAGIRPMSRMNGRTLIRPLLFATKEQIIEELRRQGVEWRTDETNSDLSYARNRIRSVIMPELERINQAAARHICLAASDAAGLYDAWAREAEDYIRAHATSRGLDCGDLRGMDGAAGDLVLMEYLRQNLRSIRDVGREHLNAISRLVRAGRNFTYDLPAGARVYFEYGRLRTGERREEKRGFCYELAELSSSGRQTVEGEGFRMELSVREAGRLQMKEIPQNNYEKWLDYDKINKCLYVRSRRPGDFFTIEGGHRQKFSDFCINRRIPSSERDAIPLLVEGDHHILCSPGTGRISEEVKVSEAARRILVIYFTTKGTESDGRED